MHRINFLCLAALIAVLSYSQAAPRPKRTDAKPAIINAGSWEIEGIRHVVVTYARVAVREDEKVSKMDIIRRQKDWQSWLKKNLRAERVKDTNIVHVSFLDGNAKEQAAIINVVVDYFFKNDIARRRKNADDELALRLAGEEDMFRKGHISAEEKATADARWKKDYEKAIEELPKLVEHAKVP